MHFWRQKLHLDPPQGWLNDPNGLSYFKGNYHIYFQYTPEYSTGEGLRCWGLYQSPDLLNFKFKGVVLRPDIPEDRTGVFSGSAVDNGDTLEIFYTGNVEEEGKDLILEGREANEIHVTTKDGVTMSKKNVVLRNSDYPDNLGCHVRDPKVWKDGDKWHMVLGARSKDDHGRILLYEAEEADLNKWTFVKEVTVPDFGFMWECPDIFEIDGHHFLSLSPQGIGSQEYKWQNVFSAGYFKYDPKKDLLTDFKEWDMGFDFYAQQTFKAPDGRRILIGWMGGGGNPYINPTTELGWQHCLTIPREITVDEKGEIIQKPIREIDTLKTEEILIKSDEEKLITTPCNIETTVDEYFKIQIGDVNFEIKDGKIELTAGASGYGRDIRKALGDFSGELRIIIDKSSIEFFIAGGRLVMGMRFYPEDGEIIIKAQGADLKYCEMKSLEVDINE